MTNYLALQHPIGCSVRLIGDPDNHAYRLLAYSREDNGDLVATISSQNNMVQQLLGFPGYRTVPANSLVMLPQ